MFARVPRMDESRAVDYEAFLIGNDPVINNLQQYAVKKGNVAVVATSCFRALAIACQVANQADRSQIPKIIILDSSKQVAAVWQLVQKYFQTCNDKGEYSSSFINTLKENAHLFRVLKSRRSGKFKYPSQSVDRFFQHLFDEYGFDYVRELINGVEMISQQWESTDAFTAIKAVLDKEKFTSVVVYPSNIVAMANPVTEGDLIDLLLRNIALLQPNLVVHTDYCHRHMLSEQVHILSGASLGEAKRALFVEMDMAMPNCHAREAMFQRQSALKAKQSEPGRKEVPVPRFKA